MQISRQDAPLEASGTPTESAHPLLDLRTRREALLKTFNDLPDTGEAEAAKHALINEICRTEVHIVDADARSHVDALVQIEQICLWEREGVVCGGEEAMERLERILPAQIERLAGEARS